MVLVPKTSSSLYYYLYLLHELHVELLFCVQVILSPFIFAIISPSLFKIVNLCDELQLLLAVFIQLFKFELILFTPLLSLQLFLPLSPILKQLLFLKKLHCESKQSNKADIKAITAKTNANIIKNVLLVIADINNNTEKTISPTNIGLCINLCKNIPNIIDINITEKIKNKFIKLLNVYYNIHLLLL